MVIDMKILMANKFFYMNGGSERVFFLEREFLTRNGIEVVDFSMQDERNFSSPYSCHFTDKINYDSLTGLSARLKAGLSFVHSGEAARKIGPLVQKTKPDLAHLHNIYHQLTPSIIPAVKKIGTRVILTLHDCKLICPGYLALNKGTLCDDCGGKSFWRPFITNCQQSRGNGLLLGLEAYWHKWRKSYDQVDLFLAPSKFMADLTAKRIPREKIKVLPNGIDQTEFTPNYSGHGYYLYFGRLSKEKGIDTLLCADELATPALQLKIAGTGPLLEKLQKAYPAADFLGYKTGGELKNLVANAAFVVVPSECYENCSMTVLEAMAMGKPIIGSRVGGIPEQIEDGRTGLLFEMGNVEDLAWKIKLLAGNEKMRVELGQAARRKLEEEYSLASHGEGLMSIYQELLQ